VPSTEEGTNKHNLQVLNKTPIGAPTILVVLRAPASLAGLLASDHRLVEPSHRAKATVAFLNPAPRYSGGTAPDFHRSSLLSLSCWTRSGTNDVQLYIFFKKRFFILTGSVLQ